MKKVKVFGFLLIIAMVLGLALPGCRKPLSPSTLPFEAIHLGNDLFVIVKTTEETKENLHLPLVARFDSRKIFRSEMSWLWPLISSWSLFRHKQLLLPRRNSRVRARLIWPALAWPISCCRSGRKKPI